MRVKALLDLAYRLADGDLSGINEAAHELAVSAGGEVAVIAGAVRQVRALVEAGGDRATKQVASLLRRALEVGEWDWGAYGEGGR